MEPATSEKSVSAFHAQSSIENPIRTLDPSNLARRLFGGPDP